MGRVTPLSCTQEEDKQGKGEGRRVTGQERKEEGRGPGGLLRKERKRGQGEEERSGKVKVFFLKELFIYLKTILKPG
jgi:hypothetical protein